MWVRCLSCAWEGEEEELEFDELEHEYVYCPVCGTDHVEDVDPYGDEEDNFDENYDYKDFD